MLSSWLPNPRQWICFFCVTFQLSVHAQQCKQKEKKVWIFPSKTSFLLWEWRVLIIWFDLVFMFDFDFVFILLFTLYFPTLIFLTLFVLLLPLFVYYFFLYFNKFGCPSKISMPPFLTVSHQTRCWGTFKNVRLYSFWSSGSSLPSSSFLSSVIKIFLRSWKVTTDLPLQFTSESFLRAILSKISKLVFLKKKTAKFSPNDESH